MTRLDNYKVTGYKNIGSADVSFNNFNVIIGTNNSGKSNFIQSFSFINYLINGVTDDLEKNFKKGFFQTNFQELIPNQKITNSIGDDRSTGKIKFDLNFSNSETGRRFHYILEITYTILVTPNLDKNYKISYESLDVKEPNKPGKATSVFIRKNDTVSYGAGFPKGLFHLLPDFFSAVKILKLFPSDNLAYSDAVLSLNQILKTPIFYFSNTELFKTEPIDRLNTQKGRIISFDVEDEITKMYGTNSFPIFESAVENILGIQGVFVASYFSEDPLKKDERKERKALFFNHFGTLKSLKELSDGTVLLIALITKVLTSQSEIFLSRNQKTQRIQKL